MKNLLIMAPCDERQKKLLQTQCGADYNIEFADENRLETQLSKAQIIVGQPDIAQIQNRKQLEWVQMTWAGMDKYILHEGFPENVRLTNASGAFGVIISEYVLGGILTLYRHFPQYRENQKEHCWQDAGPEMSLEGKRALILGTGDIGTQTAKRLKAFDVAVSGIRRSRKKAEYFDEIHTMDDLLTELPQADIVIACLPNSESTIGLLTYEKLKYAKKGALFVNVGRGLLLEENALEKALKEKIFCGAVLDVHREEPLPKESPLWEMENVLITPHISGPSFHHCKATEDKIWNIVIQNLKEYSKK